MTKNLPTPVEGDDEAAVQAKYDLMSGKAGLEIFCSELKEKGVELPHTDIWRHMKRADIESCIHATFGMLGGVPGMAWWAKTHPTEFYTAYMKLAPAETVLPTGNNIIIQTGVGASVLDLVEVNREGQVVNSVNAFKDEADD